VNPTGGSPWAREVTACGAVCTLEHNGSVFGTWRGVREDGCGVGVIADPSGASVTLYAAGSGAVVAIGDGKSIAAASAACEASL
jgi:hypothetical protein